VSASTTPKVAAALAPITRGGASDEDFEYVWSNFVGLRDFFGRAAEAKRAVLFSVSG
jgi:hypothetical protein